MSSSEENPLIINSTETLLEIELIFRENSQFQW